ncbi:hypothetical protein [Candidatus Sororendozoicomonas aggregata]
MCSPWFWYCEQSDEARGEIDAAIRDVEVHRTACILLVIEDA